MGDNVEYVQFENNPITSEELNRLGPGMWLNSDLINYYICMIKARNDKNPGLAKVGFLTSYFYSTLKENGYERVRRYSRKVRVDRM